MLQKSTLRKSYLIEFQDLHNGTLFFQIWYIKNLTRCEIFRRNLHSYLMKAQNLSPFKVRNPAFNWSDSITSDE